MLSLDPDSVSAELSCSHLISILAPSHSAKRNSTSLLLYISKVRDLISSLMSTGSIVGPDNLFSLFIFTTCEFICLFLSPVNGRPRETFASLRFLIR